MRIKMSLIAGVAVVAVVANSVNATVMLTQDNRQVDILVDASDLGGSNIVNPSPINPAFGTLLNSGYDSGNILSPQASVSATASASQFSSFDATPSFMSISASAMSSGNINADFDFNNATVSAESTFSIQFNITTAMTYTLIGSVTDESSGSTGRVRLRPVGGSDIFIQSTSGAFSDSQLLAAGDYELIGDADIFGFVQDGGFFSRDAGYDFTFTLVPEPASGILLLIGAGLLIGRRRLL